MAKFHRRQPLGDPHATRNLDLLWEIKPDGIGVPINSAPPGRMKDRLRKSPGSMVHLRQGILKIDLDRSLSSIEMEEFNGGTARLLSNGTIQLNDPDLVIE